MIQRIIVCPRAVENVVEALVWCEAHAAGLGDEVMEEILRAIHRAADNPQLFASASAKAAFGACSANRFPYRIFFSVIDDTLYVHAILHGARQDRGWTKRV